MTEGPNHREPALPTRPSKLSKAALEQAALGYLEQFASSSENLRQVLRRRIKRAAAAAGEAEAARAIAEDIIARYLAAGLLDDRAYAAQQTASLARRGVSAKGIAARLARKGVAAALIRAARAEMPGGELAAACALVRRRRLGPCRAPGTREAAALRDLAVLARAGFSLDLARRVLAARDPLALDRLAREDDQAGDGRGR